MHFVKSNIWSTILELLLFCSKSCIANACSMLMILFFKYWFILLITPLILIENVDTCTMWILLSRNATKCYKIGIIFGFSHFMKLIILCMTRKKHRVYPDQTAPIGAVWSGYTLFAKTQKCVTRVWTSNIQVCWNTVSGHSSWLDWPCWAHHGNDSVQYHAQLLVLLIEKEFQVRPSIVLSHRFGVTKRHIPRLWVFIEILNWHL